MRVLLTHPGTQYSHRLASELNRIDFLYKFITGIAFTSDSLFLRVIPKKIKDRISNRILDASIASDRVAILPVSELISLYKILKSSDIEKIFYNRNKDFQTGINEKWICNSDCVIGFDTSSWIIADRAKKNGKPFFLDQSIAHPKQKHALFKELSERYPDWISDIPLKSDPLVQLEEMEHKLATKIVVASTFTKNSLVENGVPSDRIFLNPYGVGNNFFTKRAKRDVSRKIRFVYLGALGVRKGLPFLIDAWMERELYTYAEFWLAGPANEWTLKHIAKTPGFTYKGNVAFKNMPELIASCDCLVFPSFFEGFGQIILEAMAAGLPVITSDSTAGPDVISHGEDGLIFRTGDKKALIDSMKLVIENPDLAHEMGIKAQEKARFFSWNSYGDRWRTIITSNY